MPEYIFQHGSTAKRNPVQTRYDILMPEFIELLAKIAKYGAEKYGDLNWQKSRLTGEKGPINHIYAHLNAYQKNEPYDHAKIGTNRKYQLGAIAFNAMMEYFYESYPERYAESGHPETQEQK